MSQPVCSSPVWGHAMTILRRRESPMKCYQANSGMGLSGLLLREIEEPHAGYRQVLVRVRANSLNFRELSILRGTYPLPVKGGCRIREPLSP